MDERQRKDRILEEVRRKMNKTFKVVLTLLETESRKYEINPAFFIEDKTDPQGKWKIRKALLDNGNDLVKFLEIILDEIEVVPIRAIVDIGDKDIE